MKCPICGSSGKNVFDFFYRCGNCGFIFNHNKITFESKKYTQSEIEDIYFKSVKNIFDYSLKKINKYSDKGKLLDIGCGYGYFIDLALKEGWLAEGIEIELEKYESCIKKGLKVYFSYAEKLEIPVKNYDVITLFSVLSQTKDFELVFKNIIESIKDKGILFIRDYNSCFHFFIFKFLSFLSFLNIKPFIFHKWNFSKKSIEILLKKYNFEIIEFLPSHPTMGDQYKTGGFLGKYGVFAFKLSYFIFSYLIYYLTFRKILISSSFVVIARKKI
jgi:2-polyprenyl-3-methyl-5-hydroxy-6-metoxy-1,4-benzoquinol methylase